MILFYCLIVIFSLLGSILFHEFKKRIEFPHFSPAKVNKNQKMFNNNFKPPSLFTYKRSSDEINSEENPESKRYKSEPSNPNVNSNQPEQQNTNNHVTKQINGISVQFPVTPYPSQIAVMNAIMKGCTKAEHCLIESPTGSGKTLALLCAALAWQTDYQNKINNQLQSTYKDVLGEGTSDNLGALFPSTKFNKLGKNNGSNEDELRRIPKIYYGSRTHKQIEQVIREFKKTVYGFKKMTILSSREFTCINSCSEEKSKTELCNELRNPQSKNKCMFYDNHTSISSHNQLIAKGFKTPWDIEDFVQLGRKNLACPYFAARALEEEAEIIFCPYNYILDPSIRDSMKINLNGEIIIIDEGHNIENVCRDIASADFREDYLLEVIDGCNQIIKFSLDDTTIYKYIVEYLQSMHNFINSQRLETVSQDSEEILSVSWTGEKLWGLFQDNNLGGQNFMIFKESCRRAIEIYLAVNEDIENEENLENAKNLENLDDNTNNKNTNPKKKKNLEPVTITYITKKFLDELLTSLGYIRSSEYQKDFRCSVSETLHSKTKMKNNQDMWYMSNEARRLRTIRFLCMNPAVTFKPIEKAARSIILASGTLSPLLTFESELSTKFGNKLQANHVINDSQVYVRSIAKGPSGVQLRAVYDQVNTKPFQSELGKLILQVCQTVPHGVLCFFSSYTMMKSQLDYWEKIGVMKQINLFKRVFKEPKIGNKLDDIMKSYRSTIEETSINTINGINGALFFGVFRGKVAEGIDFSDNEARCVLTVGIPFAVFSEPSVKLKMDYNNCFSRAKCLLSGYQWYEIQAFRALNQALGRCIRHKNDWGAVLLVDERFLDNKFDSKLPKWIRHLNRKNQNYDLSKELRDFVGKQSKC